MRSLPRNEINLGVSIDDPGQFHDLNRKTRAGQGTFDKTLAGIRILRRANVPFHVISVLSAASMAAPGTMFDFFIDEGTAERFASMSKSQREAMSPNHSRKP